MRRITSRILASTAVVPGRPALLLLLGLAGCIEPAGDNPTAGLAPAGADPGVSGVSGEAGSGRDGLWADPNLDNGGFAPGGLTETDPLLPPGGLNPY